MSDALARDIQALAALFKAGGWQEVRVEADGFSLLLSEDSEIAGLGSSPIPVRPAPVEAPPFALERKDWASTSSAQAKEGNTDAAWIAVAAPNLGTFYRSPKPGAAPFVEIGGRVEADTEICLLEVMKLFTSVKAGVVGIVRRVCVADGALVEGGQLLFYIEGE
jgi:acetyl-CoA carboxylase biotin carboxyl carrier protein